MISNINYHTLLLLYYYIIVLLLLYDICLFTTLMSCSLPFPHSHPATVNPKPLTTHTWLHIKYASSVGLSVCINHGDTHQMILLREMHSNNDGTTGIWSSSASFRSCRGNSLFSLSSKLITINDYEVSGHLNMLQTTATAADKHDYFSDLGTAETYLCMYTSSKCACW